MFNLILLQEESSSLTSFLPLILMFLVIYLFMIRPGMRRQKREKNFQQQITKGTLVVMSCGIHGKINEINEKDNSIILETSAGKIKFEKNSISLELSKKYIQPDLLKSKK